MVTNYHVVQGGSAVRHARCEKCGCDYEYELIRRCDAYTSTVLPTGEKRLQARAAGKAEKKLARMLKTGVDPVACPDCGWYQSNMVREIRRRRLRPLFWIGILPTSVLAGFAGVFLGLFYSRILTGLDAEDVDQLWRAVVGSAVLAALCLGGRYILNRFHNPNSRYPDAGPPIRGAPVARRIGASAASSVQAQIEPATDGALGYARQRPEVAPGGWVTVQLARLRFPATCCHCMTPTDAVHTYQVQELVSFDVRMCPACSRRENDRLGICIVIGLAIACLLAVPAYFWFFVAIHDIIRRVFYIALFTLGGGIGIGLLLIRIVQRLSPTAVAFKNFKTELNTIELRFRNQGYTDLFLDAQG